MPFYWNAPSNGIDAITTGLNSLAAGQNALSATITPGTTYSNRPFYADVGLLLASFSPVTGSSWNLYVLPTVDDTATDFADLVCSDPVHVFWTPSGTSVTRNMLRAKVLIPDRPYKLGILSNTGTTTLASSGNILRYWPATET